MKTNKLISVLALLMLIFVLASCNGEGAVVTDPQTDPITENSTEGDVTEAPPVSEDLVLFENGEFKFKIIRPANADTAFVNAAVNLRKQLEELTGAKVTLADDFLKKGDEHDPNTYEILVGPTNYAESEDIYNDLNYGTYRIEVRGNKIIIAANDGNTTAKGVNALVYHLEDSMKDGKILLSRSYAAKVSTDSLLSLVPAYNEGSFNTSYTGTYNEKGFIYKSTTKEDFKAYVDRAVKMGCTLYDSSEMGQNLGATLTSGNAVVTVFFTEADDKTRVIIEDKKYTSLTVTEAQNKYEKVCDSVFVQLGLEQPYDGGEVFTSAVANFNNGMGYIFRLHDGSFIIIDGGFNKDLGAKLLYDQLYELAIDKNNIVIAAWIMSHQHGDHIGTYRRFTERYANRGVIRLERVIYNMSTSEEAAMVNEGTGGGTIVKDYISRYSGAVSAIARPGQIQNIRNAKIEVLHTIDLLRPASSFSGGNSFCIAVKITIEGQTYLFAGDSHTDMTASLVQNYGSYLKSDFCQVVHHGATGASTEFYKAVDPTVVIWPLGTWDYYPWRRYESYNQYLFESPNVKEIILAGYTNRVLSLPYTFPTEKVLPEEIEVTWNYLEGKN